MYVSHTMDISSTVIESQFFFFFFSLKVLKKKSEKKYLNIIASSHFLHKSILYGIYLDLSVFCDPYPFHKWGFILNSIEFSPFKTV